MTVTLLKEAEMIRYAARLLSIGVVCLLLGACASSGPKYSEAKPDAATPAVGDGRIYIYRTVGMGLAVQPDVKINGEVVGQATPDGYFYVDRKPGNYEITTTTEVERKLSLTLERDQTRYVRLNISFGFFVGHVYPELVDNDVGMRELQDRRYTGK
jgi:hypothetical protein